MKAGGKRREGASAPEFVEPKTRFAHGSIHCIAKHMRIVILVREIQCPCLAVEHGRRASAIQFSSVFKPRVFGNGLAHVPDALDVLGARSDHANSSQLAC